MCIILKIFRWNLGIPEHIVKIQKIIVKTRLIIKTCLNTTKSGYKVKGGVKKPPSARLLFCRKLMNIH